jgi:hypothetical protein
MAKGSSGGGKPPVKGDNSDRNNGKASKKRPKVWNPEKRRLVTKA